VAGFFEGAQVYYYPTGGFLDWHMDIGKGFMSTRKLGITLQLSEESEYDGGDLEFMTSEKAPRARGAVVIFPTYMMHRVSKVTRGERYSLVSWAHGPPYR
jgi:PKHD-type hydroxylase